jgi:hypothetical protein
MEINWQRYLFYGADITEEGIELFENILIDFRQENINFSYYFKATSEDNENCQEIII